MATNVVSISELVRILEKNVSILKTENLNLNIDLKFRDKVELFSKLSCNVTDKLQSLLYLSENYTANNDLKKFANSMTSLWYSVNKKICEKYFQIRMASRTLPGVPLSLLFERIKKEKSLTKESLHIYENEYDREHLARCYALLDEIEDLSNNLERCDDKLQNYLAISKLIPFLVKLESSIDSYISNVEISPIDKSECSKLLNVFPIVTKLLTGELLDNEPMDPNHVLMDNAPKKPVFIIKTKRKSDIPVVEAA
ncbi:uncharacterized protein LOC114939042 [Nylanderia fulva]|uniref:uncharacterized protein LOC114939042 n=1 Tax=Nylanderia fulva TaxID=613905 RepID=UPI0010FB7834|nr:uncharacterized protein LOC114939042 [Nylanderia fulva]